MNSSHHANRSNRGQSSGRSRGRRGRSRGGFRASDRAFSDMKPVPNIRQVVIGAPVSMILKLDQPTGREVQGIVAELLTKGDHPRGIKVRLQDGRVGRVQRMVSEETAKVASEGLSDLGRNGEMAGGGRIMTPPATFTPGYSDFRVDSPDAPPTGGLSLEDYVVVKGQKKGRKRKGSAPDQEEGNAEQDSTNVSEDPVTSVTSTCPVCGEFEGDEVAVAHHVNGHFD